MALDVAGRGLVAAPVATVFAVVADLGTYPSWLGIVLSAEAVGVGSGVGDEPAWSVELGARIGPLRRSKRVRMVRTSLVPSASVVFERVEEDGREHSPWVLRGSVAAVDGGTEVAMDLHYGGGVWVPGLDLLLREEVKRAPGRLYQVVKG